MIEIREADPVCCICGKTFTGWGNNPHPVVSDRKAVCCDRCNLYVVLPARIKLLEKEKERIMPDEV